MLRIEYLATINKLEDPLIFEASPLFYFRSKSSVSTSQIQIKNPGETKGDVSGNERWYSKFTFYIVVISIACISSLGRY